MAITTETIKVKGGGWFFILLSLKLWKTLLTSFVRCYFLKLSQELGQKLSCSTEIWHSSCFHGEHGTVKWNRRYRQKCPLPQNFFLIISSSINNFWIIWVGFIIFYIQQYNGNRRIEPTQNWTHEIKNVFMMLILG